jgi:hypothetical protein
MTPRNGTLDVYRTDLVSMRKNGGRFFTPVPAGWAFVTVDPVKTCFLLLLRPDPGFLSGGSGHEDARGIPG